MLDLVGTAVLLIFSCSFLILTRVLKIHFLLFSTTKTIHILILVWKNTLEISAGIFITYYLEAVLDILSWG